MVELPWDFSHGKVQLFQDKCRRSIIWPWCHGASNVAQDFNEKSQLATFVSATSATSSPSVSLPQDRQWTQLSRTAGDAQQSCTVQVQVLLPTDLTSLTKLTALCGSTSFKGHRVIDRSKKNATVNTNPLCSAWHSHVPFHLRHLAMFAGWWLGHPSEKFGTSIGMMTFPIYGKI